MNGDFFKGQELGCEQRSLRAEIYNRARLLLSNCQRSSLFVPIRSMQYLAVLDEEEFLFVDGQGSERLVELAWRRFQPQQRDSLEEPVPFELVYYQPQAPQTMMRLQGEFAQALRAMDAKLRAVQEKLER